MQTWKLSRIFLMLFVLVALAPRTHASANQYYNDACSDNCGGFRVYGDYLYWKITQDQMDYAAILPGGLQPLINGFDPDGGSVVVNATLGAHEPSFKYNSGFRVGVGYTVPCSDWDFDLAWTRFDQKFNSCVSDSSRGVIPITFPVSSIFGFIDAINGDSTTFGFASSASSHWKFEYNIVDFEVGKKMNFCNCVAFRPYVGVKLASIRQKQDISYGGISVDIDSVQVGAVITNSKKNDFKGVGPSFGFDAAWEFFPDWNLTSGLCGALVYGKYCIHEQPQVLVDSNVISVALNNSKNCRFSPTVNGNIGIDWETTMCDNFRVKIGVAYEVQYWWNQWRASSTVVGSLLTGNSVAYGDLMLQGLTVNASVGF